MKKLSLASSLLFFSLIVITFSNCRNRAEIIDPIHILGKWNVMSYIIDAEEQIGTTYNKTTLNFGEIRDGEGPFALITEDLNGNTISQGGVFSLSTDFTILFLTINGNTVEYAINFDKDSLIMQGVDENNQTIKFVGDKEE